MRCIYANRVFLGGKSRKKWRGQRHRVQNLVTLENCFEKIVMAANNSGFYSTYLHVSKERRERERRERQIARINRPRASEEESRGKFMKHLETCLLVAEADRVLCHLLCQPSFCTASAK